MSKWKWDRWYKRLWRFLIRPFTINRTLRWANERLARENAELRHRLIVEPNSPVLVDRLESALRMARERGYYEDLEK